MEKLIHTPEGVRDIYGSELAARKSVNEKILSTFNLYGYKEIETPTFEYFDIFSNEIGTTPSRELYKFFDREGDTLVLRPDFTPSIARSAVKYFMEDGKPVRLSYSGRAFTNNLNLQGKLKETTQSGAELIGDGSVDADCDVLAMVIETLKNVGFERFTVSIGEVGFFKGLCEEAALDEESILKLREQISVKNYYGAGEMLKHRGVSKKLQDLILRAGDVLGEKELKELAADAPNERAKNSINRLIEICDMMSMYGLDEYISIDLGMLSKFNYYTGLIFKAYTYGAGDAIAKGGRYDGLLESFGHDAPAIGCVFHLDDIVSALSAAGIKEAALDEAVVVEYEEKDRAEAFKKIAELRKSGKPAVGRKI
jgi:ATP phosphoribosyltransferase regulatory subunit